MKEKDFPDYYIFGPWPEDAHPINKPDGTQDLSKWQAEARRRMAHSEKEYFEQLRIARSRGWDPHRQHSDHD